LFIIPYQRTSDVNFKCAQRKGSLKAGTMIAAQEKSRENTVVQEETSLEKYTLEFTCKDES
jgi:hypothetical protein